MSRYYIKGGFILCRQHPKLEHRNIEIASFRRGHESEAAQVVELLNRYNCKQSTDNDADKGEL